MTAHVIYEKYQHENGVGGATGKDKQTFLL